MVEFLVRAKPRQNCVPIGTMVALRLKLPKGTDPRIIHSTNSSRLSACTLKIASKKANQIAVSAELELLICSQTSLKMVRQHLCIKTGHCTGVGINHLDQIAALAKQHQETKSKTSNPYPAFWVH